MVVKKTDAVTSERPFDKLKCLRGTVAPSHNGHRQKEWERRQIYSGAFYEDVLRDSFAMDPVKG